MLKNRKTILIVILVIAFSFGLVATVHADSEIVHADSETPTRSYVCPSCSNGSFYISSTTYGSWREGTASPCVHYPNGYDDNYSRTVYYHYSCTNCSYTSTTTGTQYGIICHGY